MRRTNRFYFRNSYNARGILNNGFFPKDISMICLFTESLTQRINNLALVIILLKKENTVDSKEIVIFCKKYFFYIFKPIGICMHSILNYVASNLVYK